MNEIRFRGSEDRLNEEILERRERHKWAGALHCPCTHCGRYTYVYPNPIDGTTECEICYAKRRYIELVGQPTEEQPVKVAYIWTE